MVDKGSKTRISDEDDISAIACGVLLKCYYRFELGTKQNIGKAIELLKETKDKGWNETKYIEDLMNN